MNESGLPEEPAGEHEDDVVPGFGTWRRIYAAVVVSAIIVMALIAAFSTWGY